MRYWLACAVALLPHGVAADEAEPRRRFGLNVKVGVTGESADNVLGTVVHLGRRFLVRPSLRYTNTTETRTTPGLEDEHTSGLWGLKVDGLVRLTGRRDVGPYAGISFGFLDPRSATSHDDENDGDEAPGLTRMWTGDVLVGAQYGVHEKIGVYGEVGLRWTRGLLGSITQTDVSTLNGGVGVVFYF